MADVKAALARLEARGGWDEADLNDFAIVESLFEQLETLRGGVLNQAAYLAGPGASSVDLQVAMELRALATGDYSEVQARERRLAAIRAENDEDSIPAKRPT